MTTLEEVRKRGLIRSRFDGDIISLNADDYMKASADRAFLLSLLDDVEEVYIDEHKRWALTCGDSSCCACMDLLALLDAINDVLEIHGKPVCYQGVPIEWSDHP